MHAYNLKGFGMGVRGRTRCHFTVPLGPAVSENGPVNIQIPAGHPGRMEGSVWTGHMAALFSAIVWGITFVSTKALLGDFEPVEILIIRMSIGFLVLCVLCPRLLHVTDRRQELWFAAAGLCGICLYYLLENIALTYTMASNVGVIVAVAPFFTAMLTRLVYGDRLGRGFLLGFVIAMAGICIIMFNGQELHVDPLGDALAFLAALVWAFYSVILRRIGTFGYGTIQTTRRTFMYGILFMIPAALALGFSPDLGALAEPDMLGHMLFLGVVASAMCFVTWGFATRRLGAVETSAYIYLIPVVTVVSSAMFLDEDITALAVLGTAMTLAGLIISEFAGKRKAESAESI